MDIKFLPTQFGFFWSDEFACWTKLDKPGRDQVFKSGYSIVEEMDSKTHDKIFTIKKIMLEAEHITIYIGKIKTRDYAELLFKNLGMI